MLEKHRVHWVLDFIQYTSEDILEFHTDRISLYGVMLCTRLATGKTQKAIKNLTATRDTSEIYHILACKLYELFKVCRRLRPKDREIVVENFKTTEIAGM